MRSKVKNNIKGTFGAYLRWNSKKERDSAKYSCLKQILSEYNFEEVFREVLNMLVRKASYLAARQGERMLLITLYNGDDIEQGRLWFRLGQKLARAFKKENMRASCSRYPHLLNSKGNKMQISGATITLEMDWSV